jgi:hypothetical protein
VRNNLSKEEVNRLVYSYQDNSITDELYAFGAALLSESQARCRDINSRAATVLTWATGVLALLFSQLDVSLSRPHLLLLIIGSVAALFAVINSFMALQLRDGWCSPSDKDWFEETALTNADEIKRFHIRSIHEIRNSEESMAEDKGNLLFRAQRSLVVAAVIMATGLVSRSLVQFF